MLLGIGGSKLKKRWSGNEDQAKLPQTIFVNDDMIEKPPNSFQQKRLSLQDTKLMEV